MHLDVEVASRREAETILRTTLARVPRWSPWPAAWGMDEAPYRAIFICDTLIATAERFSRLRRAGCLVESWPDLAPEVTSAARTHGTTIDLRRRLLAFPLPAKEKAEGFARAYVAALV